MAHAPNFKDPIGQRYGKLMVLELAGIYRKKWPIVLVKCDCGQTKKIRLSTLRIKNGVKSCGCAKIKGIRNPLRIEGQLFLTYIAGAEARGLSFCLTFDGFLRLIKSKCVYCGSAPMTLRKLKIKTAEHRVYYNGVDRVNNKKPYTTENCVACCSFCNRAKNDKSLKDFLAWIDRLIKFRSAR